MKIVYIHQYFCTPDEPGGTRSYWISRALVERGHNVIMICSTNKYHSKPGVEMIDGIEVHYVKNEYDNSMSPLSKIMSFCKFLWKSTMEAKKQQNVDVVFATSTPLTVGGVALALKRIKKWPFVFEVRDLWPEFPIQIGAVKNPAIIWALRKFEKRIYNKSNHIVALSPGMKDGVVASGISDEKVTMIPNMSKPEEFKPHQPDNSIAKRFNIDLNNFNIIHFGSMGKANGLMYIIETAKICQEEKLDNVQFLFMGDGATQPMLKAKAKEYGLKNVIFLGSHPMETVAEVVNLCDASITSFMNLPILQTNSPNKLFDSLSAGKPIIVNSAGWTKDLVENENCGFYVDPDNPRDFVNKIKRYMNDKSTLAEWGQNARRLSETTFNRNILANRVVSVIEEYANK